MNQKTKKLCIAAIIFNCAGIIAFSGLLVMIERKSERVRSLFSEIETQKEKGGKLDSARAFIEATSAQQDRLNSFGVSNDDDEVTFISFLERLGSIAGANVDVKNPQIEHHDSSREKDFLHVDLSASGNWQSVMNLILLLENAPMDISLGKINLTASGAKTLESVKESSVKNVWNATIELRVLKFKDELPV